MGEMVMNQVWWCNDWHDEPDLVMSRLTCSPWVW